MVFIETSNNSKLAASSTSAKRINLSKDVLKICSVGNFVEVLYQDDTTEWKIRRFRGVCYSKKKNRRFLYNQVNGIGVSVSLDLTSPLIIHVKYISTILIPKRRNFSLKRGKDFGLWFF